MGAADQPVTEVADECWSFIIQHNVSLLFAVNVTLR